jgi:hypothetical protein
MFMQRLALFSMLLFTAAQQASAAGVVRIADGDCAGLSAAASVPPGQEPSTIVLARKGNYTGCSPMLNVTGNITIDGAGALMPLIFYNGPNGEFMVAAGASLTLRNLNFGAPLPGNASAQKTLQPKFAIYYQPAFGNSGTLVLDSVAIANQVFGVGPVVFGAALIANVGNVVLRNTSIVNNTDNFAFLLNGNVDISHSTIANNTLSVGAFGGVGINSATVTVANSIIANSGGPECASTADSPVHFVSRGGNIINDNSCGFNAPGDRVIADAKLGTFGTHGGVVGSLALSFDSPAVGNGLAANCEAADARGAARGQTRCDAGAYEFGGGLGQLGVSGTSGLYFNSGNNGHYVTVQRVFDDNALVIWNTFDQTGKPAWVYGVGSINGGHIHVDQVAENLGGVLHPGGGVSGVTPTFWGTLDLDFSSCGAATLKYDSALPKFGTGTVNLERLAFVTGLDCSP